MPFNQKTVSVALQYRNGSYPCPGPTQCLMVENNLVNPGKHWLQSNMNNNTETIPWLIYWGIRLDVPDDEGCGIVRQTGP
jgi:hypothetical protein